jgi:DNA-binding response OmpR family regulator
MEKDVHILIVDDEPNILIALRYLLEKEGYRVSQAEDGKAAIDKYSRLRPDIIVMDVMMPEMDGFAAAKEIRRMDTTGHSRLLFLTAKGTPQDRMTGYSAGGERYLVKPFDNEQLLQEIKEIAADIS